MIKLRIRALFREKVLGHSMQRIFSRMYEKNSWANADSASGDGSDLTQTRLVRAALPGLVAELGVTSMLDTPCGDFFWMKEVQLGLRQYIGGDIVPTLIAANTSRFGSDTRRFQVLDITADALPRVDLIFCRDCLVHLPNEAAVAAIRNFARSGSTYLLTTTYPNLLERNKPLHITGNWRPVDLTLPPFSLPAPLRLIEEGCTEKDDFPQKSLGLWKLADARL